MQARILGAIDVGSNSIRLMVARVADHKVEVLATRRITTRMILGVVDGYLTGEAIERNAQAIASLAGEAREKGAEEVLAFGTSAMRDAENRGELIDSMNREPVSRSIDRILEQIHKYAKADKQG